MSILERAEADFREKLSGKMSSLEVPEWGENGTPLKVFWKPLINFKAQEKIFALVSAGKTSEAVCQTLVTRALDEEGKHLFQQNEMEKLMRFTDPNIISRIVEAMSPEEDETIDSVKKN